MKIELGTLQWTMEVRDGNLTCHMDVLQDNTFELRPHVPDGNYRWRMVLDLDTAEKVDDAEVLQLRKSRNLSLKSNG